MATLSRHRFTAERWLADRGEPPTGELVETEFAYLIDAPLPGVRKADLSVRIDGQDVWIGAVTRRRCRTGVLRWRTDCIGRLEYRLTLPAEVERDGIAVRVLAGQLGIRIPKTERMPSQPPVTIPARPAAVPATLAAAPPETPLVTTPVTPAATEATPPMAAA